MPFTPWAATIGNIVPPLPVASGGTGAATAAAGLAALGGLGLQAGTGISGFALTNGTPTILSWVVPNDGALHRFFVLGEVNVTVAETGGQIGVNLSSAANVAESPVLDGGGHGIGLNIFNVTMRVCKGGQTVTVAQFSALTAGTATAWAEIWGL